MLPFISDNEHPEGNRDRTAVGVDPSPNNWHPEETSRKVRTVHQHPGQIIIAPFNMTPQSLAHLHGESVLVKSTQDRHDPPIALRGLLDTRTSPGVVKVVLQYPDMCLAPAHQGIINLDARTVDLLLEEGHEGPYMITVQESIDPE